MAKGLAPKKIVLTLHTLSRGGTDRVACYLATGFAEAGFDVHLVIFCEGGDAQDVLTDLIDARVSISYLGPRGRGRTADLIRLFSKCVARIKQINPDVVISTCNNMNWITTAASERSKSGARLILKTTNPIVRVTDRGLPGWLRRQGYRLAFERADRVLALCDVERALLAEQFPSASPVFHSVANPYVSDDIGKGEADMSLLEGKKVVLNVGRFEAQKDMDLLIRSFALVTQDDAVLVLLGDGALKPACEELVQSLGLEQRVLMPGFVSDVPRWLRRAELFALTSVYEGFPAVILEAMAAKCLILSTDSFLSARKLLSTPPYSAVLEQRSPSYIAAKIDAFLALKFEAILYDEAARYSIQSGVNSHIDHINEVSSASA